MDKEFRKGDRVKINLPMSTGHGKEGTVVGRSREGFPHVVIDGQSRNSRHVYHPDFVELVK